MLLLTPRMSASQSAPDLISTGTRASAAHFESAGAAVQIVEPCALQLRRPLTWDNVVAWWANLSSCIAAYGTTTGFNAGVTQSYCEHSSRCTSRTWSMLFIGGTVLRRPMHLIRWVALLSTRFAAYATCLARCYGRF